MTSRRYHKAVMKPHAPRVPLRPPPELCRRGAYPRPPAPADRSAPANAILGIGFFAVAHEPVALEKMQLLRTGPLSAAFISFSDMLAHGGNLARGFGIGRRSLRQSRTCNNQHHDSRIIYSHAHRFHLQQDNFVPTVACRSFSRRIARNSRCSVAFVYDSFVTFPRLASPSASPHLPDRPRYGLVCAASPRRAVIAPHSDQVFLRCSAS